MLAVEPTKGSDSPLKIAGTLSTGDGTTTFDDFKVETLGGYSATLTVEDGAGQTDSAEITIQVSPNLPPHVIAVPWVAYDPLALHETFNGKSIRLKGIVRDADPPAIPVRRRATPGRTMAPTPSRCG